MKIGIVASSWYWDEITSEMVIISERTAKELGCAVIVKKVPGCFDMPLACQRLLGSVDGIVTLGAIIEGQTRHDELISHALAGALVQLSLQSNKPIVLGVNGPGMTKAQAIARIERAADVTRACIGMIEDA